jgi:hypothetical protein
MRRLGMAILVVFIGLTGCATPGASTHTSLKQAPDRLLPKRVLLLPAEIRVHEISAGGVIEKVDAWSEQASAHVLADLRARTASGQPFQLVEMPSLNAEDKANLDQHAALYEVVAGTAFMAKSGHQVWRERTKEFDYTIGPGLKALADDAAIDAALITIGTDYISSSGRKAAMVMGAIVTVLSGVIAAPAGGMAYLSVGIVDLRTGDLLWYDTARSQSVSLRDKESVHAMLSGMFATYPGVARDAATPSK